MPEFSDTILSLFKDSSIPLGFIAATLILLIWQRKAQPSILSLYLLAVPIAFFAASIWIPLLQWVGWLFTPILMLVMLIDGLMLTSNPETIHLRRVTASKLSIGRVAHIELNVTNNSPLPLQIELFDDAPPELGLTQELQPFGQSIVISPHSQSTLSYELMPTQRGIFPFGKIHARYKSRLGLLWITLKEGRPESVTVTPDMHRIKKMRIQASKALATGELHNRSLGLEGTQFSGLRHYLAGDDIKKMAWQATARMDIPVLRTFEHEVEQPVLILLDASRKMSTWTGGLCKYDWALTNALGLASVAFDRKDSVSAATFSHKLLQFIPFGHGQAHWKRLIDTLSSTEVQFIEPDYESVFLPLSRQLKRRTLIVLFTDLIDPIASQSLLKGLNCFSNHHQLIIATLSDEEAMEQALLFPKDTYQSYQKGVALDLLTLRRQALTALSKVHRAVVIDTPPSKLDEQLVQHYIQLKQRSLV